MSFGTRRKRRLKVATTVLVWGAAVGACLWLYQQSGQGTTGFWGLAHSRTVSIAHLEGGRISKIHVNRFDRVRAGQILVQLDDTPARESLQQVEVEVARIYAEIEAMRARIDWENQQEQAVVERSQLNQQSEERARFDLRRRLMVDRESAQLAHIGFVAELARDRMLLQGAEVRLQATRALSAEGFKSTMSMSDAESEVRSLEAVIEKRVERTQAARLVFEEADRRWFLYKQQENLEVASGELAPLDPERQVSPLRMALDAQQHKVEALERTIGEFLLRAEIDGQVTRVHVSTGEVAMAGEAIMTIGSESTDRIVAYVREDQVEALEAISVGAKVEVTPHHLPASRLLRSLPGKILAYSPRVEETPRRHWALQTQPEWGRPLLIELDSRVTLSPGEKVWINPHPREN